MLNHVIMSQIVWALLLPFIGTAQREVCLGSYCGYPLGGEAAVAEESSSEMEADDLETEWGHVGISRSLLCLSCKYGSN